MPTVGSTLGRRLEKHDGVARDGLAPADGPDMLAGLGLDVHSRSPTRSSRARLARIAGL